jgi:hypothetical protein
MVVVAGSYSYYKPIAEEVRFTGGDAGVAFSVSSTALDYLKQQLLPYLYDKISNLHIDDKSFSELGIKFDLTNINILIP